MTAIGMQLAGEDAGRLARLEDDGAGAVADRTQVVRSEKSRMREKTSEPMTSAFEALPVLIIESAIDSA